MAQPGIKIKFEFSPADIAAFKSAMASVPDELKKDVTRSAFQRIGTQLRRVMGDAAVPYSRTGTLARSMRKKVKITKRGAYLIVGPSRNVVGTITRSGGRSEIVKPGYYAHLPELGTMLRVQRTGRKRVYVPWLKKTVKVTPKPGQKTGRVTGGKSITRGVESAMAQIKGELITGLASDLERVAARIAKRQAKRIGASRG